MSETKHTPGNWRAFESAGYKGEWGVETDDRALVEAGEETILYPSHPKHLAELVAAAPDLLAALQNLMGVYDTPLSRRRFPQDDFMREALENARSVIRKAGGSLT